jgi:hypothetical protein
MGNSAQPFDPITLGVTNERFQIWETRKATESKRRDGIRPESRLLYFSDLTDLHSIIFKNWETYKECFGNKKKFDVYLSRLEDLRNPNAHSRRLAPFEVDLVKGICGELRQDITLYLAVMNDEPEHFPRIERVEDSFGNVVPPDMSSLLFINTGLTVRPGDVVVFTGSAWDPDSMEITWNVQLPSSGIIDEVCKGNNMTFTWNVTQENIGDPGSVAFGISSPRTYHRGSMMVGPDDTCYFSYRVLPSTR